MRSINKGNSKTKAAPDSTGAASKIQPIDYAANNVFEQRKRITDWFATSPTLTTEQARKELDIMHPAGRVQELRARGFDIQTHWDNYPTACGKTHRMARYVYMGKTESAA